MAQKYQTGSSAHNGIQLNGSQTTVEQIGNRTKVWFTKPFTEVDIKIKYKHTGIQFFLTFEDKKQEKHTQKKLSVIQIHPDIGVL